MSLFDFFKKSNSKSNFTTSNIDEIVLTGMFIKSMINADGIETEEETKALENYITNCGFTDKEQVDQFVQRSIYLNENVTEFEKQISNLNDIQKFNIITELVRVMGVDGNYADEEVDYLFDLTKRLKIDEKELLKILEKVRETIKISNNTINTNKLSLKYQISDLENNLKVKSKDSKELGIEAGLDNEWIIDYNAWFDVIVTRSNLPQLSKDHDAKIRMIDGHYQEYHYRMIDHSASDKTKFIFMRVISFDFIYNKLKEINSSHFSDEEMLEYESYLFHSYTSLYGAIKFAILDMDNGKEFLDQYEITYDMDIVKAEVNKKNDTIDKSIELFSDSFRNDLNKHLIENAEKLITEKKNTKYNGLIELINNVFPISNETSSNDNIGDPEFFNSLNKEQKEHFGICFGTIVVSARMFDFIEYFSFLLEFYKKTELEIPDIIEDYYKRSELTCSNCNSEISINDKYCGKCGYELSEEIVFTNDLISIDDIESYLSSDENPNKHLFNWAYDLNQGKKGVNISEEKMINLIESEVLNDENLDKITGKIDFKKEDNDLKKTFKCLAFGAFIRIDIDYLASILNETENNKFIGWNDVEQYHAIYTLIHDYINKNYNPHYDG